MSSQEKIALKTYEPFVAEMAAKYEVDAFIVWNILDHFTRRAPSEREKAKEAVIEAAKLFDGGNCICAYGTRGNPCRVCKLKTALAALGDA